MSIASMHIILVNYLYFLNTGIGLSSCLSLFQLSVFYNLSLLTTTASPYHYIIPNILLPNSIASLAPYQYFIPKFLPLTSTASHPPNCNNSSRSVRLLTLIAQLAYTIYVGFLHSTVQCLASLIKTWNPDLLL